MTYEHEIVCQDCGRSREPDTDVEYAYLAVVRLLKDEWPSEYSLLRIVEVHGPTVGVTDEQIEAVRRIDARSDMRGELR